MRPAHANATPHLRIDVRPLVFGLSIIGPIFGPLPAALAACNLLAPNTGDTVTCDTSAPNPTSATITAIPGSTNVTVNILPGAELDTTTTAIVVSDQSTVFNDGTLNTNGYVAKGIMANGTGAGNDRLVNRGSITTTGEFSEGLYTSAASSNLLNDTTGSITTTGDNASAMIDFEGPGNTTLTNHGYLSTSGTGSYGMAGIAPNDTLVNTGSITVTGPTTAGLYATGDISGRTPYGSGAATLINTGSITASGPGAFGILTLNSDPVTVTNDGLIAMTGQGGDAVFMNESATFTNGAGARIVAPSVNGVIANGGGTLDNAGSIDARDAGLFVGAPALITNTGSITSTAFIAIQAQGNVNVSIDNSGTLSGAVAAVQTDAGNDTFTMSGGSTTGIVNLGAGANAIVITGGTVGSGITTSTGPSDSLVWRNAGVVIGSIVLAGLDNTATLIGLTDTNLNALTTLSSGTGTGTLTLDHTQTHIASRFTNWTSVQLTNASQLTLDTPGLTLGNAVIGTGALGIDATSTLFAGGLGDPPIAPAIAGQLVTVRNAGTISLTNGGASTTDALVIHGNYIGLNGTLQLQTVLGDDNAPSDRLVISQGSATGRTAIGVANVGGTGAATLLNGILVVQALDGATTTASAFTLQAPLEAGAYAYALFKGGVNAGTSDNWYLRSSVAPAPAPTAAATPTPIAAIGTPPLPAAPPPGSDPTPLYRIDVPIYAEMPELARTLGIAQLGTFDDRHGDPASLTDTGLLSASWAHIWGSHLAQTNTGTVTPEFSGDTGGLQIGQDVYADVTENGHRNHAGLIVGFARASGDVSGFALGFPEYAAGRLAIDAYSVGAYWTHVGPGGAYTDTVLMGSLLSIDPTSNSGVVGGSHGHMEAGSIEGGLPMPLAGTLSIEPQAQLILQHVAIDDIDDGISTVALHSDSGLIGRIGVRAQGTVEGAGTTWVPYARANLWRTFDGTDTQTYANTTVISARVASTAAEFDLGLAANFSAHGSAFAAASYTTNVNGAHRSLVTGNAGMRWRW
ncbi:autotransporter outer membrane beta-barrel domain-containing protein [Pararobbsia silviterrae]|uniref:Autotransporter outer membrane beta-barrel domain-containing protein n=1 Tax=Pararobbsia silviterrae TaxID=1792498 RepID=A0A494Y8G4_9BURK|nr:autotransporter outer membrane beta-barrel domain-containing protein [Pararobbsia silviterrae]RKP58969.1 autotransporter outer membrane beta-barrel domain-containing protein [Pararobbsia silviterrae]